MPHRGDLNRLNPVEAKRLQIGLKATFLGMAVNSVLAAVKFAAGFAGQSHALIADAVDSMADILASVIVWRGLVVANEPPDRDHPYGHGKAEPIAAAVVSTMLILAGIAIAFRSLLQITQQREPPASFTLWILLGVIAIKEGLFRYVSGNARKSGSMAVQADAWHHRSDAITSVAAAIGISVALVGGPGYEMADDAAAFLAAGLISWNGWRMLRPALDELMDTAPSQELLADIARAAAEVPGVHQVEKCIARKAGYQYFVDMHIEVNPQLTVQAGHQIAHKVKAHVRETVPSVHDVLVHVEPIK